MTLYKKLILFLSILSIVLPGNIFANQGNQDDDQVLIIVKDHFVLSNVHPYIEDGRTFVPIRFIAEELGFYVKWIGEKKEVHITDGKKKVQLTIDSKDMTIDEKRLTLDVAPRIKEDRTFVPLRAIAEAFDELVDWSQEAKTVFIGENPKYHQFYPGVYYYNNEEPVISTFTFNAVSWELNPNLENVENMVFTSRAGFLSQTEMYFTTYFMSPAGHMIYELLPYHPKTFIPEEEKIVPKEKQLKDEYYISSNPTDPLIGSWYGKGTTVTKDEFFDSYVYITKVKENYYHVVERSIKENGSQLITKSYLTFDPKEGFIDFERSYETTKATGDFKPSWYAPEGRRILIDNTHMMNADDANIVFQKY